MRRSGLRFGSRSHRLGWSPVLERIIPMSGWMFERSGLDVRGVRILSQAVDLRFFTAILDRHTRANEDPVAHFARHGLPFPKPLLGYRTDTPVLDSRTQMLPLSLRQADIPDAYLEAGAVHLCPLDYLTHSLLPALLRQAGEQYHIGSFTRLYEFILLERDSSFADRSDGIFAI